MALAKLVARDGVAAQPSEWPSEGAATSHAVADLERHNQALVDILRHDREELAQLRAEKRELEARLKQALEVIGRGIESDGHHDPGSR